MKTKQKGYRAVAKYIEDFLSDGDYIYDKVEKTGRFVKQKDLFGLFDLVACDYIGFTHYIQVTHNKPHPHKKFSEFAKTWGSMSYVIQAVWYDRKGWKIFKYNSLGNKSCDDMRKKK